MAEEIRPKMEHPFAEATVAFAVDLPPSTDEKTLLAEKTFIRKVAVQLGYESRATARLLLRTRDSIISTLVNRTPLSPELAPLDVLEELPPAGSANPTKLLQDDTSVKTLLNSTIWFLLTSGLLDEAERKSFKQSIGRATVHGTPCVNVKFGTTRWKPSQTDFSVGESVFDLSSNALILFYNTEKHAMLVMKSKGIFDVLLEGETCPPIEADTPWIAFPEITYKDLTSIMIPEPTILAEDEVLLDGSVNFRFADLLANKLGPETVDRIISSPDNLRAVVMLARSQTDSDKFKTWAQNAMWDYDEFLSKPRVDGGGRAKSAFLALSEAITEGRDQDRIDQLKLALRAAHASNWEDFHEACRGAEKLRRSIIRAVLEECPQSIRPGGSDEWVASVVARDPASSPFPDTVMGWHALLWNPGFTAETEKPHLGVCSICGVTDGRLCLLLKVAPQSSVAEPVAYPKYSNGENIRPEWPWKAGCAAENEVLCTSICCCDPCSTYCLALGFAGTEDKLAGIWPIGQYWRNEDMYRTQLERAFRGSVDPALAPMVFLSILLKARKSLLSDSDLIQLGRARDGDVLEQAVSRAITDLIKGIRIKEDGLPPRLSEEVRFDHLEPTSEPTPESNGNAKVQGTSYLPLQERLPTAIQAMNGRLYKPGDFLSGFSLPAFSAAFEAACVALGPGAAEPHWTGNLRAAALKRYLFLLTESLWSTRARDQRRWPLTRKLLRNFVEPAMEVMGAVPPATILGTPLLRRSDYDLIRGLRCFKDIEGFLSKATAALLQELVGIDESVVSSVPERLWTAEFLSSLVISRAAIKEILKEVMGSHVEERQEEKDPGEGSQDEKPEGAVAESFPYEEVHGRGSTADKAPDEDAQGYSFVIEKESTERDDGWGAFKGKDRANADQDWGHMVEENQAIEEARRWQAAVDQSLKEEAESSGADEAHDWGASAEQGLVGGRQVQRGYIDALEAQVGQADDAWGCQGQGRRSCWESREQQEG